MGRCDHQYLPPPDNAAVHAPRCRPDPRPHPPPRCRVGLPLAPAGGGTGFAARLRRHRPHAGRPRARRFRGIARIQRRGPRPGAEGADRHRAEPRRRRHPAPQPVVVGCAARRTGVALRRSLRHRLGCGCRAPAAACARRRARRTGCAQHRGRRAPLLRAPLPDRGRHRRRIAARGARPPALRTHLVAPRRLRAELPPLLRGQHPRGDPGRGPAGLRRVSRRDRPLAARRARRRAARRPPGRAPRPGRVPPPPVAARRGAPDLGGEDPGG